MHTEVNKDNLSKLLSTDKLVMFDIWAAWCGPCKMIAPALDALSEKYKDDLVFLKHEIKDDSYIANKYSVKNIPFVVFIKNGQVVETIVGAKKAADFEAVILKYK